MPDYMLNREVIDRIPEKFRRILLREIEPLVGTKNVLAIGLVGSLARGDYWDGADIDLGIIVRKNRPYVVLLRFKEVEIDFAYFNESQLQWLPYDIVPFYDPNNIIDNSIEQSKKNLVKAKVFLCSGQVYTCLSTIHQVAEEIAEALILLIGEAPTTRRTISRLEKAMKNEESLFERYLLLYNMADNLKRAEFFYHTLKDSYNEIWDSLIEKGIASVSISPESTFHNFFRSRFESVYHYDKRDFIWFTFHEFLFVSQYFFKLENLDSPLEGLDKFSLLWAKNYGAILETIPVEKVPVIHNVAQQLVEKLEDMER